MRIVGREFLDHFLKSWFRFVQSRIFGEVWNCSGEEPQNKICSPIPRYGFSSYGGKILDSVRRSVGAGARVAKSPLEFVGVKPAAIEVALCGQRLFRLAEAS